MKGAIEVLIRYLAKELGPRRIAVNAIARGHRDRLRRRPLRDDPELNRAVAQTALGRVGLPDDVGGAVAMLLSPESGWITGQRIEVSGGQTL
jgi:NAD(P)-dependent dehydrogenase (short-subunit alcohol dehydrogenase family)